MTDIARFDHDVDDCLSCGSAVDDERCPSSRRLCGHHCNHSWTHDECCWCGLVWDDEGSTFESKVPT